MTGSENTIVGNSAGRSNTTGAGNTFIGSVAGLNNKTGDVNTFVGGLSGVSNTQGRNNTFIGYVSGASNTTGSYNAFLGDAAGNLNTTGLFNTFLGSGAGNNNSTGSFNTFVGQRSGYRSQTGQFNTFLGGRAGYNAVADSNTFVGYRSGYNATSGAGNTFFGYQAGQTITTGSNNVIIGPSAGSTITDGNDNVLMGYNSQADDGLHNATAIGSGSRVAISNALILGNGANVGIGTSAPATRLEVVSPQNDQSGLRLTSLTTNSPSTLATDQFLTVNQQGDVVKARYQLRISDVSQWSDKVFSPTYQLRPLRAVASYVRQQGHLPGVPSAEQVQREGVDLVKMNSLLLEKVEELTLYGIEQEQRLDKQQATLRQQQDEIEELKRLVNQLMKK